VAGCKVISLFLVLYLGLAGCQAVVPQKSSVPQQEFRVQDVAKTDIDLVAETNLRLSLGYLEELTAKLYRRNPVQLRRGGRQSIRKALDLIFRHQGNGIAEIGYKRSVEAVYLAFDPAFHGDRVLALSEGLRSMLILAYGGKQEFFMMDSFDPQKLYNMARNLEITAWKLGHTRDNSGRLFLLSNGMEGRVRNLSYERLFGQLIGLQDSMAHIVANSSNRQIKNVIQRLATAVFLPI